MKIPAKLLKQLPALQRRAEEHAKETEKILEIVNNNNILIKEIYRIILLIQKQYPEKEEK